MGDLSTPTLAGEQCLLGDAEIRIVLGLAM
jgi:hypothetical protein